MVSVMDVSAEKTILLIGFPSEPPAPPPPLPPPPPPMSAALIAAIAVAAVCGCCTCGCFALALASHRLAPLGGALGNRLGVPASSCWIAAL